MVLVPALVFLLGWEQHGAQGMVLAALCFIPGAYFGAQLAEVLPAPELGKLFGLLAFCWASR